MTLSIDNMFIFNPSGITAETAGTAAMTMGQYWQQTQLLVPQGFVYGDRGSEVYPGSNWSQGLGYTSLMPNFQQLVNFQSIPADPTLFYSESQSGNTPLTDTQMASNLRSYYINSSQFSYLEDECKTWGHYSNGDSYYTFDQDKYNALVEKYIMPLVNQDITAFHTDQKLIALYTQTLDAWCASNPNYKWDAGPNGIGTGKDTLQEAFNDLFNGNGMDNTMSPQDQAVNAMVMSKVIASIGADPSNYGITSDQFNAWMSKMEAAPTPQVFDSNGVQKQNDPYYPEFFKLINQYVSTAGNVAAPELNSNNPINPVLNTYFQDSLGPQETSYGVELSFLDPSHANVPPPIDDFFKNLTGVDLQSADNKQLYRDILNQYAQTYGFSKQEIQRILQAHEDATYNDPWAQQMELRIQSQQISDLIQQGKVNVSYTMQNGQVSLSSQFEKNVTLQLPKDVQNTLAAFASDGENGKLYNNTKLSVTQMSEVITGILVAGASRIDEAKSIVQRMSNLSQTVEWNGVLIIGAAKALETIIHPVKATLMNFLAAMSSIVLDYRNAMMQIQFDDTRVDQKLNLAKRSEIEDSINNIEASMQNHEQQRIDAANQKQQQSLLGWIMIALAALMAIIATIVTILTLGAGAEIWAAEAPIATFTTTAAVTSSATAAGSAAVAGGATAAATAVAVGTTIASVAASASVGLAIAGTFQLLAANGIDIGRMILNSISSDAGKNALMGFMLATTIALAILTVLTLGATTAITNVAASIAASTAVEGVMGFASSITSSVANEQLDKLIMDSLMASGMSEGDAAWRVATILAIMNLAITFIALGVSGMGKALANVGKQALEAAKAGMTEDAASLLNKLKSMLETMKEALESAAGSAKSSLMALGEGATWAAMMKGFKAIFTELGSGMAMVAKAVELIMNLVSQILTALYDMREGQFMKNQAVIDQAQSIIQMSIQILDQVLSNLPEDDQTMMQEVAQSGNMFQQMVSDLSKAVTAITSNSSAPIAAASSGSGAQNDTSDQNQQQERHGKNAANVTEVSSKTLADATPTLTSAMAALNVMSQGKTTVEGHESKFMSTTSTQQMTALMALTRLLAVKIANMLQQMGVTNPMIAEHMGMKVAGDILKQLAAMQKGQIPLGKDAKETFGKNSVMATIAFMLSQKGLNPDEQHTLDDLFKGTTTGSDNFDDEQLTQLGSLLKKMAENDPSMESLSANFQSLVAEQKTLDPMEFSFRLVQLFAQAFGMGQADFRGLKSIFGDDICDGTTLSDLQDGSETFSDLVTEYFSAPTSADDSGGYAYA